MVWYGMTGEKGCFAMIDSWVNNEKKRQSWIGRHIVRAYVSGGYIREERRLERAFSALLSISLPIKVFAQAELPSNSAASYSTSWPPKSTFLITFHLNHYLQKCIPQMAFVRSSSGTRS